MTKGVMMGKRALPGGCISSETDSQFREFQADPIPDRAHSFPARGFFAGLHPDSTVPRIRVVLQPPIQSHLGYSSFLP
jgi:hypothetical protein